MTDEQATCPVCNATLGNPGALGTHLALSKDADHVAYRVGTEGPSPALTGQGDASLGLPPALAAPLLRLASGEAPLSDGAFGEAGEARQAGEGGEAEARQAPPPHTQDEGDVILLPPPATVEPLIPPTDPPGPMGQAPQVSVPLEPILAGALAIGLNGLVLNKPGDRQLTSDMVAETQFPKSVEACLRHYFPDLPLSHPIVALIASGTGLGMLVLQLKGKAPEPERPREATPQATVEAAPMPAPRPGPASTGDAYWDAILAQAGGIQA